MFNELQVLYHLPFQPLPEILSSNIFFHGFCVLPEPFLLRPSPTINIYFPSKAILFSTPSLSFFTDAPRMARQQTFCANSSVLFSGGFTTFPGGLRRRPFIARPQRTCHLQAQRSFIPPLQRTAEGSRKFKYWQRNNFSGSSRYLTKEGNRGEIVWFCGVAINLPVGR